jgi:hypothetical protein
VLDACYAATTTNSSKYTCVLKPQISVVLVVLGDGRAVIADRDEPIVSLFQKLGACIISGADENSLYDIRTQSLANNA